jgi:hypothetical protein
VTVANIYFPTISWKSHFHLCQLLPTPLKTSSAVIKRRTMSYYFTALSDDDAIRANEVQGGPFPGNGRYDSIDECDVLASPHFWQLSAIARNVPYEDHTSELRPIWPVNTDLEAQDNEPVAQFIQRLPDSLRDELAQLVVTPMMTSAWADCVWGMDANHAELYIQDLAHLAARALREEKHMYWWSTT